MVVIFRFRKERLTIPDEQQLHGEKPAIHSVESFVLRNERCCVYASHEGLRASSQRSVYDRSTSFTRIADDR